MYAKIFTESFKICQANGLRSCFQYAKRLSRDDVACPKVRAALEKHDEQVYSATPIDRHYSLILLPNRNQIMKE